LVIPIIAKLVFLVQVSFTLRKGRLTKIVEYSNDYNFGILVKSMNMIENQCLENEKNPQTEK